MLQKMWKKVLCLCVSAGFAVPASAEMVGFWNFENANVGYNSVTGAADVAIQGTGASVVDGQFVSSGLGYLKGTGTNGAIANLPVGNSNYAVSMFVTSNSMINVGGKVEGMGFMGWGNYAGNQVTAFRAMQTGNDKNAGLNVYWWGKDLPKVYDANTWGSKVNSGFQNHIATTYDGSNRYLYINGQEVGADGATAHDAKNQNFTIGATMLTNSEILNGAMDNASLYSNSLLQTDLITIASSRYNGLVAQWVTADATGTNKIDRIAGTIFSTNASAGTRLTSASQTLQFNRTLNASETAFYTGQIATGHAYNIDAAPGTWTAANTAWVRGASQTYDGSATALGIYVGGTTTGVTLTTTPTALNKSNLTLVLGGGTLAFTANSTQAAPFTQTLIFDGGKATLPGGNFYVGGAGKVVYASGTLGIGGVILNFDGTSEFVQTGGSLAIGTLNLATTQDNTANSSFTKTGGTLTGGTLNVGQWTGNATFTQNGGFSAFSAWFTVADTTSTGQVFMNGGTLSGKTGLIGNRGVGSFTQTDGDTAFTTLAIGGDGAAGRGTLNLDGGTITVNTSMIVGDKGKGFVSQTGGVLTTPVLTLQNKLDDHALAYDLTGGVLNTSVINGDFVQNGGALTSLTGTLTVNGNYVQNGGYIGFADNNGTVNIIGDATFAGLAGSGIVPTAAQVNNTTTFNIAGTTDASAFVANNASVWEVTRDGNLVTLAVRADMKERLEGAYVWKGGDGTYTNQNWQRNGADTTDTPTNADTAIVQSGTVGLSTTSAAERLIVGDGVGITQATVNEGSANNVAGVDTIQIFKGGTVNGVTANNTDYIVDGGTLKGTTLWTGSSDIILNSGSIYVEPNGSNGFRIGHAGTAGSLVINGGEVTTSWFTMGEVDGIRPDNLSTVEMNGGTFTSRDGGAIMVGRGGKSEFVLNGGTVNARGVSQWVDGSFIVGSHNNGKVYVNGGTLNVDGEGLNIMGYSSTMEQTGGFVNVTSLDGLKLGVGTSYTLKGGRLSATKITGAGTFAQTGGALSPAGLQVIGTSTITGDYSLRGGTYEITVDNRVQSAIQNYMTSDLVMVDGIVTLDQIFTLDFLGDADNDYTSQYLVMASKNEINFGVFESFEAWNAANIQNGYTSYQYLTNLGLAGGYNYGLVAQHVPEPSTWILLLAGCGLLLWRRKK